MSKLYVNEIYPQSGDTVTWNSALNATNNISSSGDFYSLGSVSASNNLAIGGNAEFSGTLKASELSSSGDIYTLGSISASNNVTIGGNLYISGTILGITASNAVTALNNQAENRLVSIGSTTTELDGEANLTFDGTTLKTLSGGHVSSSGDVYALGSVSASNNVAVGGNLHITGTLNKAYTSGGGHVSSSGDVYALGSVSASNNLAVGGNAEITGSVVAASLSASGDVYALGSVSASNNLTVGGNAEVSGSLSASLVYAYGLANAQSLNTITIPANYNSVLYGPISIETSETVTIGVDSNVKIVDIADV